MSSDGGVPSNTPTPGRCLEHLDVFVIAGGLGTRIEPVLGKVPEGRSCFEFCRSASLNALAMRAHSTPMRA